jgi:hypothetical protein
MEEGGAASGRIGGEVVTVQIGSFANYVGAHYWNLLLHGASSGKVDLIPPPPSTSDC